MAGINLSQSIAGRKDVEKKSLADKSLVGSLFLLVIVLGVWGGMRVYLWQLDSGIAGVAQAMQGDWEKLHGSDVDRIANLDARAASVAQAMSAKTEPSVLLGQLERLTIQGVALTKYAYDQKSGKITLEGTTDDYKYVAEQVVSLKADSALQDVEVSSLKRDDKGKVGFSLTAVLAGAPATAHP